MINMKAIVSYTEASSWISKRFRFTPTFKRIDDKTLEISYRPGNFIPAVSLICKIEALRKDIVCLSYECSMPVSLLVAGTVGHLQRRIPDGIEINPENKRVNIYIERFDKSKKVLEHVTLSDVTFSDNEFILSLSLL